MIRLTLIDREGSAHLAQSAPYFRITGATVWTLPGDPPIVRYTESDGWVAQDRVCAGMRFEGRCRLVMGFHREPSAVSEVLLSVAIVGGVLFANGVPFASYDPASEMWRAAMAEKWWHAFRIEAETALTAPQDSGQ